MGVRRVIWLKGKNTGYRVLPDGKTEVSAQGTEKILGKDVTMVFTEVSTTMPNGIFMAEGNDQIWTKDGDVVFMKSNSISWSSEKGGTTRSVSLQMTHQRSLHA